MKFYRNAGCAKGYSLANGRLADAHFMVGSCEIGFPLVRTYYVFWAQLLTHFFLSLAGLVHLQIWGLRHWCVLRGERNEFITFCDFACVHGCIFDGRGNIWRTFSSASVQNRSREGGLFFQKVPKIWNSGQSSAWPNRHHKL